MKDQLRDALMGIFIVAVIFIVVLLLGASASAQQPFETSSRGIVITAKVDGQQGRFLIDTGATRSIITPRISGLSFAQLAATPKTRAVSAVVGAEKIIPLVNVKFTIGHMVFHDAQVWVSDLKDLDGIIGMDLLSRFEEMTIDYRAHTLELK